MSTKLAAHFPEAIAQDDLNLKFRLAARDAKQKREDQVRADIVHHICQCAECDFATKTKCLGLQDMVQDYEVEHVKAVFYKLLMD